MDTNKTKAKQGETVIELRAAGKEGTKLDPFAVGAMVKNTIGYNATASINGSGAYIIKAQTDEQANKLTKVKKLGDGTKVKITRHATLNTIKCLIQSPLITDMPDEELATKLRDQGVTKVRSIKPNNRLKIIYINGTTTPRHIWIGLIKTKTMKYYNMPKTCRKCKELGHITEMCEGTERCGQCSGVHKKKECKKTPHCINCNEAHPPLSKGCPSYQQEKAIIKLHTDQDIAPKAARKQYQARNKGKYIPLPAEREPEEEPTTEESDTETIAETEPETDNNQEVKEGGTERTKKGKRKNSDQHKKAKTPEPEEDDPTPIQQETRRRKEALGEQAPGSTETETTGETEIETDNNREDKEGGPPRTRKSKRKSRNQHKKARTPGPTDELEDDDFLLIEQEVKRQKEAFDEDLV